MRILHRSQKALLVEIAAGLQNRIVLHQITVLLMAPPKTKATDMRRRAHGRSCVTRIGNQERSVLGTQEAGSVECFEALAVPAALDGLADIEECRHVGISWSK